MSPTLLLTTSGNTKKWAAIISGTFIFILAMPMIAVFSLGAHALQFLANTSSSSDSTMSISTTTVGLYEGPAVAGDTYAWGNCTYWVFAERLKAGDPIPTTWGNAATWSPRAAADGHVVNHTPSLGAIMQTASVDGGLGHVAYVTAVDPVSGRWTISEMNVMGLDVVDIQVMAASAAESYNFIHDNG